MEMYIGLAVLVVVLIWVVMTYNRFISLRRFKDEAWSGIAVQLKRRHDLAPNLLSLVKRYAQHEKELLEEISRQRGELVGSTRQIADSERQYSGTLGRVFALGEAYPELKASENYLALQQSLSEIEEQLQMARRYFNGTVRDFNILVESFPSLLLARLFLKPSNLLILDEPTNDLDVETLELLEELIDGYQGTVMLVSHDRQFVDNTVTECWIFEGGGHIGQYVGGYHDARGQQAQSLAQKQTIVKKTTEVAQPKAETVKRGGNKLSYNLQRELEQLPQKLETLEAELQTLQEQVADPDFFGQSHDRTQQVLAQLAEAEQALEAAFERWEYLEGLKNGA